MDEAGLKQGMRSVPQILIYDTIVYVLIKWEIIDKIMYILIKWEIVEHGVFTCARGKVESLQVKKVKIDNWIYLIARSSGWKDW